MIMPIQLLKLSAVNKGGSESVLIHCLFYIAMRSEEAAGGRLCRSISHKSILPNLLYVIIMLEMEKKEQESLEKAKRYAAQKKELLKRKKAEESKKRTHRLCQVGGAVESVLGAPIEEEDIPKLIGFLKKQEANGKFFSKAMQKETNTDMEEV